MIVLLGLAAASGPADDVFQSPAAMPLLSLAELSSFEISPPKPDLPAPSNKPGSSEYLRTGVKTPEAENALITGNSTKSAGAELLHDVRPIPTSTTVTIPAAALISRPKIRTIWVEVTAYCSCKKCCGPNAKGLTSSGRPITYNGGHFIAADLKLLPYGTRVIIPGYNNNKAVEVIDRGGAIRGYHIDIFMPTHQQAVDWGKKRLQVVVVE
ncbi:MAG TPA: 3D domain-containing protein [Tepidisphaeraceae bacterium]|nr:3D domain-containing protein [Tepidisphaeraceae bacterium]